jgi:hypothetical protein
LPCITKKKGFIEDSFRVLGLFFGDSTTKPIDRPHGADSLVFGETKLLIAVNDNRPPRLVSKAEAARYCGVTPATFAKWVLAGILPPTVSITSKYDMRALDAALDKLSGIVSAEQQPEDSFETWKRGRDAKTSSRR